MAEDFEEMQSTKPLRCNIIGAGVSGILMACKLQEAFGSSVKIQLFEKNCDVGGTWLENRYPGCACDVPSHIYQFTFCPNPYWSKFYASSTEIQSYLKAVTVHHRIDKLINLNSQVTKAAWNEESSCWTIKIEGGGEHDSEILINASGILNNHKFPELKGFEDFRGQRAHTAAWDPQIDVTGKRVAIIGAGASAIQVLPALQAQASHIDVYIRTPSWITPPAGSTFSDEHNHTYTADEKTEFAEDLEHSLRVRKSMEASFNKMYRAFLKGSDQQREMRSRLESRMKQLIHSEDLQRKLIPSFEAGCRRLNPGEKYLEALQKHNVEPIFEAIQTVTSDGIQDANGEKRPVDIIIAATGFDTSFRPRFPIIGSNRIDLRELWKDEPASYAGLAVSGFPNYLIFLGPNTPISNGSLIGALEATADYFVRLIGKMIRQQASCFDVQQRVQTDFNDHTDRFMQGMVWTGSCRSWFKNSRGKVTAVWPGSGLHYREFLQADRWEDFEWKYGTNRFSYWNLGFSQVEGETDPDLSYYIKQYPNLPLEALQGLRDEQGTNNMPQSDFNTRELEEINAEAKEFRGFENAKQDNWSEESASPSLSQSASSGTEATIDVHTSQTAFMSKVAAFSV